MSWPPRRRLLAASLVLWIAPAAALATPKVSYDGARLTAESRVAARLPGWRGVQPTISTPAFTAPTNVQVFLPPGYDSHPSAAGR